MCARRCRPGWLGGRGAHADGRLGRARACTLSPPPCATFHPAAPQVVAPLGRACAARRRRAEAEGRGALPGGPRLGRAGGRRRVRHRGRCADFLGGACWRRGVSLRYSSRLQGTPPFRKPPSAPINVSAATRARPDKAPPLPPRAPGGIGAAAALSALEEMPAPSPPVLLVWAARHAAELLVLAPRVLAAARARGITLAAHLHYTGAGGPARREGRRVPGFVHFPGPHLAPWPAEPAALAALGARSRRVADWRLLCG